MELLALCLCADAWISFRVLLSENSRSSAELLFPACRAPRARARPALPPSWPITRSQYDDASAS
ncbi:unnamed protein product, partial [Gulo gulo]